MARLTISLLGPLLVRLGDDEVTEFGYDKVRALLVYLAVEAERPQRREALAALLWPEQPNQAARNNLRRALLTLRAAIDDQTAHPPFLLTTRHTLQFNRASDHCPPRAWWTKNFPYGPSHLRADVSRRPLFYDGAVPAGHTRNSAKTHEFCCPLR